MKNLRHICFVHPFCSLIAGSCSLAYFIMRLTTTNVIGNSYAMSALMYFQHQPFCVAISLGAANNLSMAAAFTRTATGATGLSETIRAAKRYMFGLCVYGVLGWAVVWFFPAYHDSQQELAIFVLLFGYFPDLLIGPISVLSNYRVTAALVRNLEHLPQQQQEERRKAYKKLRSFAYVITVVVGFNGLCCLIFACSSTLRQTGAPLYALAWHLTIFFILLVRLLLLKPPVRKGMAAAVATVHPAASGPVSAAAAGAVVKGQFGSPSVPSGRLIVSHKVAASAEAVVAIAVSSSKSISES